MVVEQVIIRKPFTRKDCPNELQYQAKILAGNNRAFAQPYQLSKARELASKSSRSNNQAKHYQLNGNYSHPQQ